MKHNIFLALSLIFTGMFVYANDCDVFARRIAKSVAQVEMKAKSSQIAVQSDSVREIDPETAETVFEIKATHLSKNYTLKYRVRTIGDCSLKSISR